MGSVGTLSFSAPTQILAAEGLLFDLDGTIIDSTDAIIKHWHELGRIMGVDPDVILKTSHGRRSIDTLEVYDPSKANWEYIREMERRIPLEYGADAVEILGSRALLASINEKKIPWAIVTSGTRPLLDGWIRVLKLAHPKTLVVAEDVESGKPDPACYLLGRDRLGMNKQAKMIVFEDAPAGIKAARAAGFVVIGLVTTHTVAQVQEAGADWIVQDLRSVTIKSFEDGIVRIAVDHALVSA